MLCGAVFRADPQLPQAAGTFKWWNWVIPHNHSSLLLKTNRALPELCDFHLFELSIHARCPFEQFGMGGIFRRANSAHSNSFPWLSSDISLEYVLCSLSQASVDAGHEGHSPGHRGETVLGMPSQRQAQTLLHMAEERPAAALGGELLLVFRHLPVFRVNDSIVSLGSSFSL